KSRRAMDRTLGANTHFQFLRYRPPQTRQMQMDPSASCPQCKCTGLISYPPMAFLYRACSRHALTQHGLSQEIDSFNADNLGTRRSYACTNDLCMISRQVAWRRVACLPVTPMAQC